MHHVITLQRCSPLQNRRWVQCLHWLTFQTIPRSNYFANAITPQELPSLYCNLTERSSPSKFQTTSMLTFVWPFGTFKLAQGHLPNDYDNSSGSCNFTKTDSSSKSRSGWGVPTSEVSIFKYVYTISLHLLQWHNPFVLFN